MAEWSDDGLDAWGDDRRTRRRRLLLNVRASVADLLQGKARRLITWLGAALLVAMFGAIFIYGPWIFDGSHLYDEEGNLTATSGAIVTGFRTTLAALMAGVVAAIGLRYTHRTLQHTKETQIIKQYVELAHEKHIQSLLKAVDDPGLAEVVAVYDQPYTEQERRVMIFAEVQYRNALLAYRLEVIDHVEFFGLMRSMLQSPIFREYWKASRYHRASQPESSIEATAGRLVDALVQDLAEADTDQWWVVGEPLANEETG
jgi:hypothetical protein